jgi:hypothetical protein
MIYVGVLADDGMHLVTIEGVDELNYTEEELETALDDYFPEGVNQIDWRVLTKENESPFSNQLILKVDRIVIQEPEDEIKEGEVK